MTKQPKQAKAKAGRKETLTHDLATRIAKMIQQFPDAEIAVTWKNVIDQVNRRFGKKFHRNTFSQKDWDGRNPIVEAFKEAESVEKRMVKENAPKYADNPRSRLRLIIAKKEAAILALREQLESVRAQQYDEVFALLDLRTPLHRLVEARGQQPSNRSNSEVSLSLVSKNPRMPEYTDD